MARRAEGGASARKAHSPGSEMEPMERGQFSENQPHIRSGGRPAILKPTLRVSSPLWKGGAQFAARAETAAKCLAPHEPTMKLGPAERPAVFKASFCTSQRQLSASSAHTSNLEIEKRWRI